jgi:hypothetical protein
MLMFMIDGFMMIIIITEKMSMLMFMIDGCDGFDRWMWKMYMIKMIDV